MNFINKINSLNTEIDHIDSDIQSLRKLSEEYKTKIQNLVVKIFKEGSIEDIVLYIKEICIKKHQSKISVNINYDINFITLGILIDEIFSHEIIDRHVAFEDKKIIIYFNSDNTNWLNFNINNETNLGFYLRLFNIELSDVDMSEIESINVEAYKLVINLIENNIFK